ncbi:MAG: hypothetical protein ABW005_09910 [Burkholderiaceae bacterium]
MLNTVAAGLPLLRAQGHGQIVNLASIAPPGLPLAAVHGVNGYALRALTEGLRREAGEALRIELITPGPAAAATARAIVRAVAEPVPAAPSLAAMAAAAPARRRGAGLARTRGCC